MISKEILIQYSDLQEEVKEVRERIKRTERQIAKIEEDGNVIDTVSGGCGGIQHFKIEGFPYPEYSRKKTLLYARKATLASLEMELLETLNQVEEFIASVNNSEMRRILSMRFIDNKNFEQIGRILGYDRTSISKKIDKFLEE